MMKRLLIISLTVISTLGCQQTNNKMKGANKENAKLISQDSKVMACKLTTPELRKRKETVIASLKKQVIERKELANRYSFRFTSSDNMVDELAEFIKTERLCCDFFDFNLTVSGRPNEPLWLTITGPEGVKDFIVTEIGL